MIVLDTHIWVDWGNEDAETLTRARVMQIEECAFVAATALAHEAKLMSSDRKFPIYTELADKLL